MPITINSVPFHPRHHSTHLSPNCVIYHSKEENILEHLVLERPSLYGDIMIHSKEEAVPNHRDVHKYTSPTNPSLSSATASKRPRNIDAWVCPVSKKCKQTVNPVQSIVAQVARRIRPAAQRSDRKTPLSLASGDAIAVGKMPPCLVAVEALVKAALESSHSAAYSNACGTLAARTAIANYHSYPEVRIGPDDVIVANGCSGALDLVLNSLLDAGTTLLVPQPGFPLYEEIAKSIGANVVHYQLSPKLNWECDLLHLERVMEFHSQVRAIVINNPSSATGSVFTESHLADIVEFARRHRIPIVSDEIYGDMTFGSNKFTPIAQVAAREGSLVPVITASGISKQFLLPGWRAGWLTFHDKFASLMNVKKGATQLSQLHHGTSNLAQAAIPALLDPQTPGMAGWRETLRRSLEERSQLLCRGLERCPGVNVIPAQGATYAIIEIDVGKLDFEHDLEFAMRLADEENVFVVPGMSMGLQNVVRLSFCSPEEILAVAACRIESFCRRHAKPPRPPCAA